MRSLFWFGFAVALVVMPLSVMAQSTHSSADQVVQDTLDVQHLMAAYHEAIMTHDGARLSTLFIPQGSAWLNVLSDAGLMHMRATKPNVQKIKLGNYQDFAKFVSQSKASIDPQHSNLHIYTDGTIASVYFDYVFMIDGKPENRGNEAWQLVKGENGWRIAAITYSSNPPGT
jgi:hypothetical protein